jgi:bifunctional enzyme CysN/CysC
VQRVVRPNQEFRGYSGTIASGHIAPGDPVVILPSGRSTKIAKIATFNGDLDHSVAGQSVTLTLADEMDVIRGDMIASADDPPHISNLIEATLVWLSQVPAHVNKPYRLKHTTRQEPANLKQISYRINVNTLDHEPGQTLEMNGIGVAVIETGWPLAFDSYSDNRAMGSFILIDPATNATVAAGMINGPTSLREARTSIYRAPVTWHFKDGSLLLSGLDAIGANTQPALIDDAEALEALHRFLHHLQRSSEPGTK